MFPANVEDVQCVLWWCPNNLRNEQEKNNDMKLKHFEKKKKEIFLISTEQVQDIYFLLVYKIK